MTISLPEEMRQDNACGEGIQVRVSSNLGVLNYLMMNGTDNL